jgi:hypothetical protein
MDIMITETGECENSELMFGYYSYFYKAKWDDNIRMDLIGTWWEVADWILWTR